MTKERKITDIGVHDRSASMSPARRRLLRGGLSVAPVVLASAPRSVMAGGVCVPASSFASVNASRPDLLFNCSGRTAGYWKNEQWFANWPSGYFPVDKGLNKATQFNAVFAGSTGYPGKTFLQVLQLQGGGRDAVARHIVAAFLNAKAGLTLPNVLSWQRVLEIWSSFDRLGYFEPTAGIRWYADSASVSGTGGIIPWLKSTMPV